MNARAARVIAALPVLTGLLFHALARDRSWTVAPAAGFLVAALLRKSPPRYSRAVFVAVGAAAGLVGLALSFFEEAPLSILPNVVLSPLSAALVAWSAWSAATDRAQFAWTWVSLVVVFSVGVPWVGGLPFAFTAFLASFVPVLLVSSGAHQGGRVAFLTFLVVAGGAGHWLERTMFESEGAVMGLIAELTRDSLLPRGFGFEGQLSTPRSANVRVGDRVLFEAEGDVPERLRTSVLAELVDDQWHAVRGEATPAELPLDSASLRLTVLLPLGDTFPSPRWSRVEDPKAAPRAGDLWTLPDARGRAVPLRYARSPQKDEAPAEQATHVPPTLRAALAPFVSELFPDRSASPARKATQVEAFFRDRFEYSLNVDLTGKGHPLAVLIRERRAAYCTYFASAMAVLLRMEGIPARVVGGFVASERNALTGVVTVRERDAHAWVEVWLEEEGRYVAFDPTPWRSREALLPERSSGLFASAVDAAIATVRRTFAAARADPGAFAMRVITWPGVWLALMAFAVWRFRSRLPRFSGSRRRGALEGADAALLAWRGRYLRLLSRRAGLRPRPSDTDEELLAAIDLRSGRAARAAAARFVSRYQAARFDPRAPGRSAVDQELAAALSELEKTLAA